MTDKPISMADMHSRIEALEARCALQEEKLRTANSQGDVGRRLATQQMEIIKSLDDQGRLALRQSVANERMLFALSILWATRQPEPLKCIAALRDCSLEMIPIEDGVIADLRDQMEQIFAQLETLAAEYEKRRKS